ncbi:hypothetical protein EJ04DRAFT_480035 [Polyplosphaeria fusca]|uniref:Uncharacterized protein n=1 Tax=Polyplosphaeria fusca TaxID=682080 RepID=A0A9P4USI5_9PLEO|nr:hypothetical protein EJ04DRAFT_480035 [Polyplosphaeria fusca]
MNRKNLSKQIDFTDLIKEAIYLKAPERQPLTEEKIKELLLPDAYRKHKLVLELWTEFCTQILQKTFLQNQPFEEVPTVDQIKLFLKWITLVSEGRLDTKINDVTLCNRLSSLKRAIKLYKDGYRYSSNQNTEFSVFIKDLAKKGLVSTKGVPKPIAPLEVVVDLIKYLWVCDEYQFLHPRIRIQLHWVLLLFCFTGLRPGECVESSNWKGTNEGILYRDCQLVRVNIPEYKGLILVVALRNRKGRR